jgi:DNA-binding XRE family transcriptional regulator
MTGYIYAIRCMDRVKIGHSNDPLRRLVGARVWSPYPAELLGVTEGSQADERELHRKFAAHRRYGEWFALCPEIETFIETLHEITETFGKKTQTVPETCALLIKRRKQVNLTQSELGRIIGAKKFTVSRIENGTQVPTTAMAAALERELSIPASSWVSEQKTESAA